MYIYIWKFHVKKNHKKEFEDLYGPQGAWVKCFRKSKAYIRTELLHDIENPNQYLTLDYWQSKKDYDDFHERNNSEFALIDQQGENFTQNEIFMGEYETHHLDMTPKT